MDTSVDFGLGSFGIIALAFGIAYLGLVLFCLVDILRSTFKDSITKLIWVLVIFFAPFLGSLLYLIIGRNSRL